MILIGEKLNSSIPRAQQAFEARDAQTVTELIRTQAAAGASFLDVNTAVCAAGEQAAMLWTIGLIRENCDCGIMIDTADPKVMAAAVQAAGDCPLILNSATITDRFDAVTALAKESGAPRRVLINTAFVSAAMAAGLSSAIIDPVSPAMRDAIAAARVVAGLDDYCMDYITYIRGNE